MRLRHHSDRTAGGRWWALLLAAAVAMIGGEFVCRYVLGLGDPLLMREGVGYRYICKPGQNLFRFGNHVFINRWSMRSAPIELEKTDPYEFRVMLVGDSVLFGMTLLDQSEIASSRLGPILSERLGRRVQTMNVSASSWAVGDQVSYLDEFGTFDADVVVWVINSGDLAPQDSNLRVVGVDPSYPSTPPPFALWEAISRYLLPRLYLRAPPRPQRSFTLEDRQAVHERFCRKLAELRTAGVEVMVLLYPSSEQTDGLPAAFVKQAKDACDRSGVWMVDLTACIRSGIEGGVPFYYDEINASVEGNSYLARLIADIITSRIEPPLHQRCDPSLSSPCGDLHHENPAAESVLSPRCCSDRSASG